MIAEAALTDDQLELLIDIEAMLLHTAKTPDARRAAMSMLTKLHQLRSPKKVAQMEQKAGLR